MNGIQRSQVQIPLTPTFYSYFKEFFSGEYHVYLSFRYTHVITSRKLQLKTNVATDEGTSKDTSVVNTIYTNIYIYIYIILYISDNFNSEFKKRLPFAQSDPLCFFSSAVYSRHLENNSKRLVMPK